MKLSSSARWPSMVARTDELTDGALAYYLVNCDHEHIDAITAATASPITSTSRLEPR